jgi:hypothetical protein
MNVSHKDYFQVFFSMRNDISTRFDNQILSDEEYFTSKCYSDVWKNSNRIFLHGYMIYYHIESKRSEQLFYYNMLIIWTKYLLVVTSTEDRLINEWCEYGDIEIPEGNRQRLVYLLLQIMYTEKMNIRTYHCVQIQRTSQQQ